MNNAPCSKPACRALAHACENALEAINAAARNPDFMARKRREKTLIELQIALNGWKLGETPNPDQAPLF